MCPVVAVVVTGRCYRVVRVPPAARAKYGELMTTSMYSPGPRDGLDEGTLAELAQDGREVEVDAPEPRPRAVPRFGPIEVPEHASALIDGFPSYGS